MPDVPMPFPALPLANGLSVDVEDYYQVSAFAGMVRRDQWGRMPDRVVSNTARVLDLFARAGVRGTFFTLGCVAARHPGLVRDIVAGGHELASHGWDHERVTDLTPDSFFRDVDRTRRRLEDIGGVPVRGYRAPSFSIDRTNWWAYAELKSAGYRYSSSLNPIRHDHYGVPDAPRFPFEPVPGLLEVPVTTVQVGRQRLPCGGGGFFRLVPYPLFRRGLEHLHRTDGQPAIFYFHPWEVDPEQPRVAGLPLKSRFRHYVNLHAMQGKVERLLRDFRWDRMDAVFLGRAAEANAPSFQPALAGRVA